MNEENVNTMVTMAENLPFKSNSFLAKALHKQGDFPTIDRQTVAKFLKKSGIRSRKSAKKPMSSQVQLTNREITARINSLQYARSILEDNLYRRIRR